MWHQAACGLGARHQRVSGGAGGTSSCVAQPGRRAWQEEQQRRVRGPYSSVASPFLHHRQLSSCAQAPRQEEAILSGRRGVRSNEARSVRVTRSLVTCATMSETARPPASERLTRAPLERWKCYCAAAWPAELGDGMMVGFAASSRSLAHARHAFLCPAHAAAPQAALQ